MCAVVHIILQLPVRCQVQIDNLQTSPRNSHNNQRSSSEIVDERKDYLWLHKLRRREIIALDENFQSRFKRETDKSGVEINSVVASSTDLLYPERRVGDLKDKNENQQSFNDTAGSSLSPTNEVFSAALMILNSTKQDSSGVDDERNLLISEFDESNDYVIGNIERLENKVDQSVSPINDVAEIFPTDSFSDDNRQRLEMLRVNPDVQSERSWLAEFLCSGRGPVWLTLNIILLIFIILAAFLCLFRLLALRSCTPLLSRTLYLLVLLLSFTAAAFTAVHLIHLCFGGKEGLPILLTLLLTHTPAPCLSTSLTMCLHRILLASRLSWPISCQVLGRICTVLILLSVIGDIGVATIHSTPFLLTCRVTLTALAMLPVIVYIFKYFQVIAVSRVLRRELNGELKLMVQPAKESLAHEQNTVRTLLRDVLSTWASLLLVCSVLTIVLWTCNLTMSVFFAVSRVPVWLWWFFHTTNCITQILIIVCLILSCLVTQDNQHISLWRKLFLVPKNIISPPTTGTANEQRNFVYERVSYSSGQESSQRTSSSQNDGEDVDGRMLSTSMNPQASPSIRPRVTLQRSATFNCAPRLPMMYGYHPGYNHILPQGYQRTGSFAQIHPPHGAPRAIPPSMLLQEGGFIRFNMPVPSIPYQIPPGHACEPVDIVPFDTNIFHPQVDIEYNSLRRFPRKYRPRNGGNVNTAEQICPSNKFNPSEIRIHAGSPSSHMPSSVMSNASISNPGSVPVSPYHAIPFIPTYSSTQPGSSISTFQPMIYSSNQGKIYQTPPALPSRAGSFRSHYAPHSSPAMSAVTSPLSSPYRSFQTTGMQRLPSRPTSPPITSIAFPPPPPVSLEQTSVSPLSGRELRSPLGFRNASQTPEKIKNFNMNIHQIANSSAPSNISDNSSLNELASKGTFPIPISNYPPESANSPRSPVSAPNVINSQAEMQHQTEKSLENTVREILTSANKPIIRPRRHPLNSSVRLSKRELPYRNDQNELYANTVADTYMSGSPSKIASSASCMVMDEISVATDDEGLRTDDARNVIPNLKRNHSTAGCYYPKERKDSTCQTDDEGNKYSSFRLSQLRNKPADWYGTWAGRRKSKNGAYSIDPSKEGHIKDTEKKLSSSRASLLSIYSKIKNRKEKPSRDDSSEDSTEKEDIELSQASTSDETPTPSEKFDADSVVVEEDDDPLSEALNEIKEAEEQDNADWTMDILSSSSVLSDFYKLRSERPPPLPEVAEIES